MDPFLENPHEWPGVHADLIVTIRLLLNKGIPAHFATRIVYRDREYWYNQLYDDDVPPPKLSAENQAWVTQKLTA